MNHMIHISTITQIRLTTEVRAYYRRKRAEGKSQLEAIRSLKRKISDAGSVKRDINNLCLCYPLHLVVWSHTRSDFKENTP